MPKTKSHKKKLAITDGVVVPKDMIDRVHNGKIKFGDIGGRFANNKLVFIVKEKSNRFVITRLYVDTENFFDAKNKNERALIKKTFETYKNVVRKG